jgi:hypothetical protein
MLALSSDIPLTLATPAYNGVVMYGGVVIPLAIAIPEVRQDKMSMTATRTIRIFPLPFFICSTPSLLSNNKNLGMPIEFFLELLILPIASSKNFRRSKAVAERAAGLMDGIHRHSPVGEGIHADL